MKILNKMMKFIVILLTILLQFVFIPPSQKTYAATSPTLTDSASYSVLGHSTVTNTGATTTTGNVGVSSGTSITGFPPGIANGDNSIHLHSNDGSAQAAQIDNAAVYLALSAGSNATCTDSLYQFGTGDIDLAGKTLVPGVYCADTFSLSGTLTLDDTGAANGVWIFRAGSTVGTTAGVGAKVQFLNGIGLPCNVWWKAASSATIGVGTTFIGNILALASVTLETNATLNGRAMAQTGAVTLDTNTISGPTCTSPTTTPTPTSSSASSSTSSSGGSSSTGTTVHPALSSTVITPQLIESRRVDTDSIFISWGPYSGIDKFNVRYGLTNGNWLYNTNVTGFSTTINSLPPNQPIWVQVAARSDYLIGTYGVPMLAGGPSLPNTGFVPHENNISWYTPDFGRSFNLLFFDLAQGTSEKSVFHQIVRKASLELPVRLTIPAINVSAAVQLVGVTPNGEMEVPSNSVDVGWFKLGSRPGEKGSAVIAGHFDGKNGEAGIFTNLHKLKQGDKLYIVDGKGTVTSFVVRESRTYDPGYADEVFSLNDSAHLNLITCDGVWDGTKKSYSKRLVVFADIAH